MTDRVLLLTANFGSGHTQAARALAETFRSGGSTWVHTVELDHPLLNLVTAGYLRLLDWAPQAYRALYNAPVTGPARIAARAAYGRLVENAVTAAAPTLVVATHPFPAAAAAHLRLHGRLTAPLMVVMTDFAPHGFWVAPGVDRYCLPSHWAAQEMSALGVPPSAAAVTGIPISPQFSALKPPGNHRPPHVLVMGGGLGLGPLVEAVRSLAGQPYPDLRVTVVCGRNEALKAELADLFGSDPRLTILGFTQEIPALMARSALLVTKPGGLSCSEALAAHLPMLLLSPLPGHEEANAKYLVGTGSAVLEPSQDDVGSRATALLYRQPGRLERMRRAAREAARPDAAAAVAAAAAFEPRITARVI